ncbi:MAG: CopG family transcriptional regulator [Thermoprotei archaeon]|nr:MAG: CopG family transcriptional regulator [Thermoprotei archaeon]
MKIVTIHMPEQYVDDLKRLVEEGKYASMSEAIRVAVRRFLHRRTRNISKRMIA